MSWPYLHVLLNHFPIILTVVGALATLLAIVHPRRGTWIYALTTLTLAAIGIYPAFITGERAARMLRGAWYIVPDSVHSHSSAADITLWIVGATGLIALIALLTVARNREAVSPAQWLRALVALLAIVSLGAVSYTGYLGGEIVVQSPILASPTPPLAVPASAQPALPGQVAPSGAPQTGASQSGASQPGLTPPVSVTPSTVSPTATIPATTPSGAAPAPAAPAQPHP